MKKKNNKAVWIGAIIGGSYGIISILVFMLIQDMTGGRSSLISILILPLLAPFLPAMMVIALFGNFISSLNLHSTILYSNIDSFLFDLIIILIFVILGGLIGYLIKNKKKSKINDQ